MKRPIEKNLKQLLHEVFKPGDLIISWKKTYLPGQRIPAFIWNADEIDEIVFDSFCAASLAGYLNEFNRREILPANFNGKIHITCKACDARSVMQLIADEQVKEEDINLIVLACDGIVDIHKVEQNLGGYIKEITEENNTLRCVTKNNEEKTLENREYWMKKCSDTKNCDLPYYYGYYFVGEEKAYRQRIERMLHSEEVLPQDKMTPDEFSAMIRTELSRCIRCNACRNVCPACFCSDRCIFEKPKMNVKMLDPEVSTENNVLYHMIRFHHVAPNCTGCGECERACPMNIPLHVFFEYVNRLMWKEFEFKPGKTNTERQKLLSYNLGEDLV